MNDKWQLVLQRTEEISSNRSGDNIKKHLTDIFVQAKKWDLDPELIIHATKSNLSTIVPEARIAIENNDKDALEDLFKKASTLTNKQLRLDVVKPNRDKILYEAVKVGEKTIYRLEVTPHQLEQIKTGTIMQLDFEMRTNNK